MTRRNVTPASENARSDEPRYRVYRLCDCDRCVGFGKLYAGGIPGHKSEKWTRCSDCRGEGKIRQLVAETETPEALGVAIVTLGQEGEFDGCAIGILDTQGEVGQKWLLRPWLPSPRNTSDAGRVLQSARKGEK